MILVPGVYNYTFQCNLPIGLPTSVEGIHGHIRYSATVSLIRPMWTDQEFEEGFTVIKPVDLNDQPQLFVIEIKPKFQQLQVPYLFHLLFSDTSSSGKIKNVFIVLPAVLLSIGTNSHYRIVTVYRLHSGRIHSDRPENYQPH